MSQHPGLITFRGLGESSEITSPEMIKVFFALALAGSIAGLTIMWFTFPQMER